MYEKPLVSDLGSIARHTHMPVGYDGHYKGGGYIEHLDKFCEWSGGSDANAEVCDGPAPGA